MNYIALIQAIISAIKTIEQLMPDSPGKEKADAVIALITEIFGDVTPQLPAITATITNVVTTFKAIGLFQSKKV